MRKTAAAVFAAAAALSILSASPVSASEDPGLSEEQRATIAELNTPASISGEATATAGKYVSSKRISLYRGSALMWARDNVEWFYTSTAVTSSSAWQERGQIFPNISRARGISRTYATSAEHRWRGNYTIGAGVPTPWGDVVAYTSDYSTTMIVRRGGGYSGYWN